jgi:hypothetical protein
MGTPSWALAPTNNWRQNRHRPTGQSRAATVINKRKAPAA